jgi:hypothetical protein
VFTILNSKGLKEKFIFSSESRGDDFFALPTLGTEGTTANPYQTLKAVHN